MNIKLGDVSPLAGIISGEGLMGTLGRSGAFGLLGKLATPDPEKDARTAKELAAKEAAAKSGATGMKRGGKVSACKPTKMAKGGSVSSRADGCAQRGKTRGKMV
jgi:hypothetical protein